MSIRIVRRSEGLEDGLTEWRQIGLRGVPDDVVVDAMVDVAEDVSHAPDVVPVGAWAKCFGFLPEADGGLRDDLEFTFDGGSRFTVGEVAVDIGVLEELVDVVDAFEDVLKVGAGVFRRQGWPLRGPASGREVSSSLVRRDRPRRRGGQPGGFGDGQW